jgi:hypothetical protein
MTARYKRVSGPCSHSSSDNPCDHEDVSEIDELSVHLYMEYQEALDIQEAIQCNNLPEKEKVNNASQFLAPNPPPLPRASAVTQHPLSTISNEAPALVNEVSHKCIGTENNICPLMIPMKFQ